MMTVSDCCQDLFRTVKCKVFGDEYNLAL